MEVVRMYSGLDASLHDAVALAEIDLYTDVLAAVGEGDRPLTPEEIDRVLGLIPPAPEPQPEPEPVSRPLVPRRQRRPAHY